MGFLAWFWKKKRENKISPLYTSYRKKEGYIHIPKLPSNEEIIVLNEINEIIYSEENPIENNDWAYPSYVDNNSEFGGGESGGGGAGGDWGDSGSSSDND